MSKIAIMQPYLFPYIGYWQLINAVDIFVILDDVNYINKGFINRNFLLINNQKFKFTLELKSASQNKLIKDINIGNNSEKILKTILFAYRKSPYFENAYDIVKESLEGINGSNLSDILFNSISKVNSYLGIKTKLSRSSDIIPKNNLKGQDKIIEICKNLNASSYLNNISGAKLYSSSDFKKNDIQLKFIKAKITRYKQFNNNFVPNLSFIDLAMFNDADQIKDMLLNYDIF